MRSDGQNSDWTKVAAEKVDCLIGMGFSEARARETLVRCGGDVERAIDELVACGWDAGQEVAAVQQDAVAEQGSVGGIGARGLPNLGNTCYLTSTLQALSATVPSRRYYTSGNYNADKQLTLEFAKLMQSLWAEEHSSTCSTARLKDIIGDKYPDFAGNGQHDAHELLLHLLGGLHDNDVRKPGNSQATSKIDDLFHFQVRSIVEFPDICKESRRLESMRCLSVPVPRHVHSGEAGRELSVGAEPQSSKVHVEECLELFTRREDLDQRDWVWCDDTRRYERSLKSLRIETLPECLIIHLKRFGVERVGGEVEKIETYVEAPMELYFPQHACKYHLYAVVNHHGTLRSGHYTCHARVGEGMHRRWHSFNDSTVSRAHESEVVSEAAYLLFYERV